ncbi:MAG: TSUP family transporter [Alphaproteobacteria bacterium]|nr:TSUP family transporter [Alphaproteobacteria bacterium]
MEIDSAYLFMPLVAIFAFFLKGITGTGTATMTIALSSFFIDPKLSVILVSVMNIYGGLTMAGMDRVPLPMKFWTAIAATMIIGSVLGAIALTLLEQNIFKIILGCSFLLSAIWFARKPFKPIQTAVVKEKAEYLDLLVGTFAGFCGGFIGSNAPPLVFHFGSYLDKRTLRRLLILIFIPAAFAQTGTFWATGLLTMDVFYLSLTTIPGMFLGIYLGNKSFHFVSENLFRKILAVLLVIVSCRLIFLGITTL